MRKKRKQIIAFHLRSWFGLTNDFQELQEVQNMERLRVEQQSLQDKLTQKQQFESKFEPCLVCGDRASGNHGYHCVSRAVCLAALDMSPTLITMPLSSFLYSFSHL